MFSITLKKRELYDLECLLLGAFSPLKGFLREKDYLSVLKNMRLCTGELWPIPITLAITVKERDAIDNGNTVFLKDPQGIPLAELHSVEIYKPEPHYEALSVFGSDDTNHPFIAHILRDEDYWYIGGELKMLYLLPHYDFLQYRCSAEESRQWLKDNDWKTVVGFQTRNPMHQSHYHLTRYAMTKAGPDSKLLLTPAVGPTQICDIDYPTRVKGYIALLQNYPPETVRLVLLPLAMRMAGPREALLHSLVRANYGCSHFIVGRDHAGPSYKKKDGTSFYEPYAAQDLLKQYVNELPIKIITSVQIVYVKELEQYLPITKVPEDMTVMNISGTRQREILESGEHLPEWFTFPAVSAGLLKRYPAKHNRGLCIYFVGLSGAGKSTLANFLVQKLYELVSRRVTLLDGDLVRLHLSKGLGFTKEDRSTNVRRVGWTASEIVKHGGICVCSTIAPYQEDRLANRQLVSKWGNYVEIWVNTSVEKCEERDIKGLYKLARQGKIANFTGVNDPFETPTPELIISGESIDNINSGITQIIEYLQNNGLLLL
uniref:ATP-sulfurylase n=1 Tax=Marseillevirus LCMAC201 TaxID=2506605 RepID=A0A481YW35_9VIRU|nr:MAG: ATP-sulfurylase [Marseillevirus LCMAC201]